MLIGLLRAILKRIKVVGQRELAVVGYQSGKLIDRINAKAVKHIDAGMPKLIPACCFSQETLGSS